MHAHLLVVGQPDRVALLEETLEVLDEAARGEVLEVFGDVLHRGHASAHTADAAEVGLALWRRLGQVGDEHLGGVFPEVLLEDVGEGEQGVPSSVSAAWGPIQ